MPLRRLSQRRRDQVLFWLLAVFIALTFYTIRQNRLLIHDIQDARVASCKQTYEGVREVFMPLFPKHPNPTQQRSLDTFNKTIRDLKAGCARQTQVKKED